MRKLLIPFMTLAIIIAPAAANAAQCRDSATGKFAKCGAAGAVPASQYVAKGKTTAKTTAAAPAAAAAKPSLLSKLKAKVKPAATPAPAATKVARCKTAKGKFVKCGTPGAVPA